MIKLKKEPKNIFLNKIKDNLANVVFNTSLLNNPELKDQKKLILLDSVLKTTEKSLDILMAYTDIEEFKKEKFIKYTKIDLEKILNEITEDLQITFERKNITLLLNVEEDAVVKANEKWLKKALYNIINHALKSAKFNSTLFITVTHEKDGFLITVKNMGTSISQKELDEILKEKSSTFYKLPELILSKMVIDSLGGKLIVKHKNDSNIYFVLLPYINKKTKAFLFSAFAFLSLGVSFFLADYYFCFFPQKIEKLYSENTVLYKLENNVTAISGINDDIKISAYKNLFNTKTKTVFNVQSGDLLINTSKNRVKVNIDSKTITNNGTKFEVVKNDTSFSSSVYEGEIQVDNQFALSNEGLIYKKSRFTKMKLPAKVSQLKFFEQNGKIKALWDSRYESFRLTLARNADFTKTPILRYKTSKTYFVFDSLDDGKWYINVQSQYSSLYSLPVKGVFLSLRNYKKALKAFKNNNLILAQTLVDLSLSSINKDSYKPYLLKAKILLKQNKTKEALKYAQESYKINPDDNSTYFLAYVYYKNKNYKKSINLLKNLKQSIKIYDLLAYNYYELKDWVNAKKYLYKALELDENNKQALEYLIKILEKENNQFLLNYYKNQLKVLK